MREKEFNTQNEPETPISLSVLDEGSELPKEMPRRSRRRKILLALLALLLLAGGSIAGGYYLLRGNRVDLKANKNLPEKVTSGKDIKQAAFDSIRDSLAEPAPPATNSDGYPPQSRPATATDSAGQVTVPEASGIAATLAPPPEALLGAEANTLAETRQKSAPVAQDKPPECTSSQSSPGSRLAAAQSVRFAPVPQRAENSIKHGVSTALPARNDAAENEAHSGKTAAASPLVNRRAAPQFGAMLPVRLMGVLYTLRQGAMARLELVRDFSAGEWRLPRGTVFIGQTQGGDLDRAYLQIKGFLDPQSRSFTRVEGEVLGNDGGAGLRGKRRRISPIWFSVLDRTAQAGVQIATGVLNRRNSSVIIAADPYGTYRSTSGADGARSDQNRSFVEIPAGTSGFVMVTTLPRETPDSHLAHAEAREERLTDDELVKLMTEADPARIRAALPKMSPELQQMARQVLKEMEAARP